MEPATTDAPSWEEFLRRHDSKRQYIFTSRVGELVRQTEFHSDFEDDPAPITGRVEWRDEMIQHLGHREQECRGSALKGVLGHVDQDTTDQRAEKARNIEIQRLENLRLKEADKLEWMEWQAALAERTAEERAEQERIFHD